MARALDPRPTTLHRHSLDEAVENADEDDRLVQLARITGVVQRNGWSTSPLYAPQGVAHENPLYDPTAPVPRRYDDPVQQRFMELYEADRKDSAVNHLRTAYKLDTKPYALSVAALPKASTHASTGGGWNAAGTAFTALRVRVNEPYLDRAATSDDAYNKLIHTLGHEYQHVKQRSLKGWRTTGDDAAKGEREFMAYSWEILEGKSKKGIPQLSDSQLISTANKAEKFYNKMDAIRKRKYKSRLKKLVALRTGAGG